MEIASRPETQAVVVALEPWRRKAIDVLLLATALLQLPAILFVLSGFAPHMGTRVKAVGVSIYIVVVVTAFLRSLNYKVRTGILLIAGYIVTFVFSLALPQRPFAQVGLITLPILALVLSGTKSAHIAVVASSLIVITGPWIRRIPSVASTLEIEPATLNAPAGEIWSLVAVELAFLLCLMVLLERFYGFLMDSLTAQRSASQALEQEYEEKTAAQKKVEQGMRERQELEREIANVGDEERRRLGNELHDGVCQQVTAALLRCQALERRLARGGTPGASDFQAISVLLSETIDEAHNVALGLCPLDPDPAALAPALRVLTKRMQEMGSVRCEFRTTGDVRVSDAKIAQHLYRIAQEALSNAVRHANATRISMELSASDTALVLKVVDDGQGLPFSLPTSGMGLRTMAYRAEVMNGEMLVEAAPDGGTSVTCRVPRAGNEATGMPGQTGDQTWVPII